MPLVAPLQQYPPFVICGTTQATLAPTTALARRFIYSAGVQLADLDARSRFAASPVARLATVGTDGQPHLVPLVFALDANGVLYSAVDAKPKSTRALRRLANIVANPRVSLLVDHYADDWSQLWWVRADGTARVLAAEGAGEALELLARR